MTSCFNQQSTVLICKLVKQKVLSMEKRPFVFFSAWLCLSTTHKKCKHILPHMFKSVLDRCEGVGFFLYEKRSFWGNTPFPHYTVCITMV